MNSVYMFVQLILAYMNVLNKHLYKNDTSVHLGVYFIYSSYHLQDYIHIHDFVYFAVILILLYRLS